MKLLLFDIDGTLLNTGGVGLHALRDGFCEAFNFDPAKFPQLDLHGATDRGVAMGLFDQFEIPHTAENEARFFDHYHGYLTTALSQKRIPLPGVVTLLDQLRDETDHTLGLLTGNIARGAWTKVDAFGLEQRFLFGAFGDDHHDRNELGPIGIKRAETHTGRTFSPSDTYIIGDTPKDIACARACGAVAVAVATGGCDRDLLAQHEPDWLLDTLEEFDIVKLAE